MKYKYALLLVLAVVLLDQILKIYVKTHFRLEQELLLGGQRWARLHFTENDGMAFGLQFSTRPLGKTLLTLVRIAAVAGGFALLRHLTRTRHRGLVACCALVVGGTLGNLLDCMFYGVLFTQSSMHVAHPVFFSGGYGHLLHGKVVDMLYFPLLHIRIPSGVPFLGGERYTFFNPVLNVADLAILIGGIWFLLGMNRFLTGSRYLNLERLVRKPGARIQAAPQPGNDSTARFDGTAGGAETS